MAFVVFAAALKVAICPTPLPESPILGFEFIQAKVAPVGLLTKSVASIACPGQTMKLAKGFIIGFGFTVIVMFVGFPIQPSNVGVTETMLVMVAFVVFVAVKIKFAAPFAPKPIAVLLFVQEKVLFGGELSKTIFAASSGQYMAVVAVVTLGFGFTEIKSETYEVLKRACSASCKNNTRYDLELWNMIGEESLEYC